jgi:hypothetical protein
VPHRGADEAQILVSQAGRDKELLRLIHGAKRVVYLRTERLTLVPAGNELGQAVQRGVAVSVELPLEVGSTVQDSRLPRILMDLGAVVAFKGDASNSIRGTYLEVDGEVFLYSAAPAELCLPGANVSFVRGQTSRRDQKCNSNSA